MLPWGVEDGNIRVATAEGDQFTIRGQFDNATLGGEVPHPVDVSIQCDADRLIFDATDAYLTTVQTDSAIEVTADEPLDLPITEYVLDILSRIKIYLRGNTTGTVTLDPSEQTVTVEFDTSSTVTIGLLDQSDSPPLDIQVAPTPEGLAAALSHTHATHRTPSPSKSAPSLRGHPPTFTLGEETIIPDTLRQQTPNTGIEIVIRDSLEDGLIIAPLAHYLQASVSVNRQEETHLRIPEHGVQHPLGKPPELERETTRLLKKAHLLDCLLRAKRDPVVQLNEAALLEALQLGNSVEEMHHATPAERLTEYISVPHKAVLRRLPGWHLSTHIVPDAEAIETLPYLLDTLSLIYVQRTSDLSPDELLDRSLGDFYRQSGEVSRVELVEPDGRSSRIRGWLGGEGIPIDVFKSIPAAYTNRERYEWGRDQQTDIAIVVNDENMYAELEDVADIYRSRQGDVDLNITTYEYLSANGLAEVFETEHDLVHYIGHCETDGLVCRGGYLSVEALNECNARTFLLNACGSFYEGMKLVEKGAVTGAITYSEVLNHDAMTVGETFAQLIVNGFCFERALQMARRQITMSKDYATVGDGTHRLTTPLDTPTTAYVYELSDDHYQLILDQYRTDRIGGYYRPHVRNNTESNLCGNNSEFILRNDELSEYLADKDLPVIYDSGVHWSDEVVSLLAGD